MEIWEQRKTEQRSYSRRTPEKSPLYRLISSGASDLERSWGEIFQPTYGVLRDEVRDGFAAYLECGILAHGCAKAVCENCQHSELIAFSCKKRGVCPSCDAKRAVIFAENLVENVLLPYSHQHLVFTIPKRIRPYFKYSRKNFGLLYAAAWQSWKSLVCEQFPHATPAAVLVLHSAGELLNWHPHLHGLFLAGAILPDGSFAPLQIDPQELTARFAKNLLHALCHEGLLSQEIVDNMNSWEHSGFNVHLGDPIPHTDKSQLLFVARYLRKCPVSNERITILNPDADCRVEYHSYKNNSHESRTFSPLEFLAELSSHLPDRWEQTSRFLGGYSCRTRGAAKNQPVTASDNAPLGGAPENITLGLPEPAIQPSSSWARCMKKIFEFDPLICPKCAGTMKIKAFITDSKKIDQILTQLEYPNQRAPPTLRSSLPWAA
jgi:hypothetical protein